MSGEDLKATVRERYAKAAREVAEGARTSCCSTTCCGGSAGDPITSNLYQDAETAALPEKAVLASLGCGNPTALAELTRARWCSTSGSGGGIDVLLSARRVGPTGKAYGLDMTDDMLALARENQRKAGVENVEFLKGEIEAIPLPDGSVDVIISNCVINLSADKGKVLARGIPGAQAGRPLRRVRRRGPGRGAGRGAPQHGAVGRLCRRRTERSRSSTRLLEEAGFEEIGIEPTRVYQFEDAKAFLAGSGLETDELAREVDGRVMGAFVRATKPRNNGGANGS